MKAPALHRTGIVLAGVLVTLAGGGPLHAQSVRYTGSLGYSRGSYVFADRTETYSLYTGLNVTRGRFSLSASLPVIAQNSGEISILGGGMMPTGGSGHWDVNDGHSGSGMGLGDGTPQGKGSGSTHGSFQTTVGDPLIRGAFALFRSSGSLRSLSVEALAKAPVASVSSGVGTGSWDLGIRTSSVLGFGQTLLFAGLAFWTPGDMPDLMLQEYADASIGVGRMFGRHWSLLSSLNAATLIVDGIDPPASAGLSIGYLPEPGRSMSLGLSFGLTEASPDVFVYLGWSLSVIGSGSERPVGAF